MKKLYETIFLLLVLSLMVTAVILILSPDVIPAHYNASGAVDRFGSKYENLIFPAFAFSATAVYMLVLKYQQKKNAPKFEQKVVLYMAIFTLLLFTALQLFFGIAAINYSDDSAGLNSEILVKLVSLGSGILLIVFGNIMPKAKRNAFFGLRTVWSMANDSVWQKSQRFGGISAVLCGLLMSISAVVFSENWNMILMSVFLFTWIIACIIASYLFWKADSAASPKL